MDDRSDEEVFAPEGSPRRRVLLVTALALVLVVAAATAIGKAASYARLLHQLRAGDYAWFPLCLAGEVLGYVGYVVIYREVAAAEGGPRFGVVRTLRIVAAGLGAMVLATGAGTLAVDYWALRRVGSAPRDALSRVIALNTLEWGVLGAAAAAAAAVLGAGLEGGAPWAALAPWLAVVPLCVAAALWVSADGRYERLAAAGEGRLRGLFATSVRAVRLVRVLLTRRLPLPLAGAVLYWAGDVVCLWAGLRAFDVSLGVAPLVLAYATGYAVAALPLPAGGAGGADAAMTYALTVVGVPLAPALLGAVAYRLFSFWLPAVPALATLPTARGLAGRPAEAG